MIADRPDLWLRHAVVESEMSDEDKAVEAWCEWAALQAGPTDLSEALMRRVEQGDVVAALFWARAVSRWAERIDPTPAPSGS